MTLSDYKLPPEWESFTDTEKVEWKAPPNWKQL